MLNRLNWGTRLEVRGREVSDVEFPDAQIRIVEARMVEYSERRASSGSLGSLINMREIASNVVLLVEAVNAIELDEKSICALLPGLKRLSEEMKETEAQLQCESPLFRFFHSRSIQAYEVSSERLEGLVESLEDWLDPEFWKYVGDIVAEAGPVQSR